MIRGSRISGAELGELDRLLGREPIRAANLRGFAERYGLTSLEWRGEAHLDLLTEEDNYLVGFDAWLLELLRERYEIEWILFCRKLVRPENRAPSAPAHPIRALTHDDGAMGFLHVLEAYRRLGYGASLTSHMIEAVRSRGQMAFVHIEPDNAKPLALAMKAGFLPAGEVWWVKGSTRTRLPR